MGREASTIVIAAGATAGVAYVGYKAVSNWWYGTPETNEQAEAETARQAEEDARNAAEAARQAEEAKKAEDERLELEKTKKELAELKEEEQKRKAEETRKAEEARKKAEEQEIAEKKADIDFIAKVDTFLKEKLKDLNNFITTDLLIKIKKINIEEEEELEASLSNLEKDEIRTLLYPLNQTQEKEIESYINTLKTNENNLQALKQDLKKGEGSSIKLQLLNFQDLLMKALDKLLEKEIMTTFIAMITQNDESDQALYLIHNTLLANSRKARQAWKIAIEKGSSIASTLKIEQDNTNHINLYGKLKFSKAIVLNNIKKIFETITKSGTLPPVLCAEGMQIEANKILFAQNESRDMHTYSENISIAAEIKDNNSESGRSARSSLQSFGAQSTMSTIQTKYKISDDGGSPSNIVDDLHTALIEEIHAEFKSEVAAFSIPQPLNI